MRVIIEYENVGKKLVRNNLQVISMNDKDKKNDAVFILNDGESEGIYLSLKNMLSFEIIRD